MVIIRQRFMIIAIFKLVMLKMMLKFLIYLKGILFGKEVAAYFYWIFPNMMFNFYPWGLSINIVKPLYINKTKVLPYLCLG